MPRPAIDEEKVAEAQAMLVAGVAPDVIARELGISVGKVYAIKGPTLERKREEREPMTPERQAAIIEAYRQSENKVQDICALHNIKAPELYALLREAQIEFRKDDSSKSDNMDEAVEMYKAGFPLWTIKIQTGVSLPALNARVHELEIPLRRPRQ